MDPDELVTSLDAPLLSESSRPRLLARVLLGLLDVAGSRTYAPVAQRAHMYLPALDLPELQVELLLTLWALAPTDEFGNYARDVAALDYVPPSVEIKAQLARRATAVVVRLLRSFGERADDKGAARAFETLRPFMSGWSVAEAEDVIDAAREALAPEWTADTEQQAARSRLHRALAALAKVTNLNGELSGLCGDDLLRSQPDDPERLDVWLQGVAEMAMGLDEAIMRELLAALPDGVLDGEATDAALLAHVGLSRRLSTEFGLPAAPQQYRGALLAALRPGRPSVSAAAAFAEWLGLDPSARSVAECVVAFGWWPPDNIVAALQGWADRTSTGQSRRRRNTSLLTQLIRVRFDAERWAVAFARSELEETPIVKRVRSELARERPHQQRLNHFERMCLVSVLIGLGLRTRRARSEVAAICEELLVSDQPRSNLDVVVRLCPLLRSDYDGKQALARALERHRAKHSYKLNEEQAAALLSAGVSIPDEWLRSKAKGRIERLRAEAVEMLARVRRVRGR